MSSNVKQLRWFVENHMEIGGTAEIATSQYANSPNAAGPHYHFDEHSTAPAVRSLIKSGLIGGGKGGWRYYKITRLK